VLVQEAQSPELSPQYQKVNEKCQSVRERALVVKSGHKEGIPESRSQTITAGNLAGNILIGTLHYLLILGLEFSAFTLRHSTSPFSCDRYFRIGSRELLAWAGFEPGSS
jgi:hypothetical protein